MTSAENNQIRPLRDAFRSFWDTNLRIESSGTGLIVSPPVMDASGWQLVLHLEPLTPGKWKLSDHGKTLERGLPPTAKGFKERLGELAGFYGFERDGIELVKIVSEPFQPVEMQIFAEGLVATSHLVMQFIAQGQPSASHKVAEDRVSSFFYERRIQPSRRHKLEGKVEREIVVDFFVAERPLAVETVKRSRYLLPYMEQWGWRWTDLKQANPDIIRAMIYDPDSQTWDDDALNIGRNVCDIFVPYTETERLAEYIPA